MTKQYRSTKIFIYISIFGCLLNLVANEEGNFYLSGFNKSLEFDLEDTPNGKTLADELKSKKAMSLEFGFGMGTGDHNKIFVSCSTDKENFNIEQDAEIVSYQPYTIYAGALGETNHLVIVLENTGEIGFEHFGANGVKIGQLKNGTNSLSEFNSAVKAKLEEFQYPVFVEPLTLGYSEEPIEDKCKIGWIIAILFGGTLLAGGLYLLLSRCL